MDFEEFEAALEKQLAEEPLDLEGPLFEDDQDGKEDYMYSDFYEPSGPKENKQKKTKETFSEEEEKEDESPDELEHADNSNAEEEEDEDDYDSENESTEQNENNVQPDAKAKKVTFAKKDILAFTDSSSDEEYEDLTPFQKRQKKLQEKISEIEDEQLKEKDWMLMGEVKDPNVRGKNSLLEHNLDFDQNIRRKTQDPSVKEKVFALILQRSIDEVWDDPERQVKPQENVYEYRRHKEISQEKSKKSLAEIYEDDFTAKRNPQDTKQDEDPKSAAITSRLSKLMSQIDAEFQFRYTAYPVDTQAEVIKKPNVPAFTAEEVGPDIVSTVGVKPPAELAAKKKSDMKYINPASKSLAKRKRKLHAKRIKSKEAKKAKTTQ